MRKTIYGVIYKTTNLVNGKTYVGQTIKKGKQLEKYMGSELYLKKAIRKYGIENFEKEILHECQSKDQLNRMEKLYIRLLCPDYNIANGGQGGIILEGEEEEHRKQKLRKAILERGKGTRRDTWLTNIKEGIARRSPEKKNEIKEKISNTLKGREQSLEARRKRSETHKNFSKDKREEIENRKKATRDNWSSSYREAYIQHQKENSKGPCKKVICIEINKVFNSIQEGALEVYGNKNARMNIYNSIKTRKAVKNYTWLFEEESK